MNKPLYPIVAFLASAVVGCDDPEVEEKVANNLVNGIQQAHVSCNVNPFISNGQTGGCSGKNWPLSVSVDNFIDGSNLLKVSQPNEPVLDVLFLNRNQDIETTVQLGGNLTISINSGVMQLLWNNYYGNCPPEPNNPSVTFYLDDTSKCLGEKS